MKTYLTIILYIFFFTFLIEGISSQQQWFTYDNSGNRISKIVQGNTPNVTLTADTAICLGESIQLNASGGVEYQWNTGQNQPTIVVSPVASQYFNVTVTGANGCTTTDSVFVQVNPVPVVAAISGNLVIESYSQGLAYSAAYHAGSTYQWSVTGGEIVSGQGSAEIVVNWGKTGGTVSVAEMNEFGCESAQKAIQVSSAITQTIVLQSGWNLMSLYVEPANMTPQSVFAPILPWVQMVKSMYEFYDPSIPPAFSSLKFLTNGGGYWVKMLQPKTLAVTGTWLNNDYTGINLNNGWNLKGYIGESAQEVDDAFAGIWSNLVEVRSATKYFVKGNPPQFNTLQNLKPGEGYWIKVNSNCSFHYPNPPGNPVDWISPVNNDFCWQPVTYTHSMVCWGKVTCKGKSLPIAGNTDEAIVGVFISGECRAASPVFEYNGQTYVNLMISGENPEPVSFYLNYKGSILGTGYTLQTQPGETLQEYLPLDFGMVPANDVNTNFLLKNETIPENGFMAFPNPFNDATTFTVQLAEEGMVTIKIFDLTSGMYFTFIHAYQNAGISRFEWNGELGGKPARPGIYLVTVTSAGFNTQQKIIKY